MWPRRPKTTPDYAQIFKSFVSTLGRQCEPGDLDSSSSQPPSINSPLWHLRDLLATLDASTAGSTRPFTYCAGQILSLTPTGYCGLRDGHFCLGVSSAFYYCCAESAIRLMQSDKTFVGLGTPVGAVVETSEDGLPRPWGSMWQRELVAFQQSCAPATTERPFDPWSQPRYAKNFRLTDTVRMACAHYVMQVMMQFLWSHEVAHAISGHLPYLAERQQEHTLREDWIETPADKHLSTAVRFWMEYDADTSAIQTLLHATSTGVLLHPTGVEEIDANLGLRLRLDAMAIVLTLFVIFFEHDWSKPPSETHPQAYNRIFVAVITAIEFLSKRSADIKAVIPAIVGDLKALVRANSVYRPLWMFFSPLTAQLARTEYNDLVAQVSGEVSEIRRHSYFDEHGQLKAKD